MKNVLILFLLVSVCLNTAIAQDKVTAKIIELGKTDNRTMEHLDVLTNRFGGRLIGSDAYDNAAQWCAYQFKKWGMEVVMDEVGELPVGFNRGPWFGRMLSEDGMTLHFATPSYTSGTKGAQRGHVLMEPKTQEEFVSMKGALKGAWVLITGENNGWPIDYSVNGDNYRSQIITTNTEIRQKNAEIHKFNRENPDSVKRKEIPLRDAPAIFYKEMKDAGILGIIQAADVPIRALYDQNVLGNMTFETLPTIPDIKLNRHQYEIIKRKVQERQYFLLEFDIRNHFKMGPVKYHNVIGIIRGTEYPNEYIMMGGHLDAFDVATGGVDCGSGVTPAMEAARLIMEAGGGKPKRSIMICLWAGEEFGLLGSKHWVENNKDKWPHIVNYFNRDGGPTVANSLTVPEGMYKDMQKICEPLNSINTDFAFTLSKMDGPMEVPRYAGGSDHAFFMVNALPAISFGTGDPKGHNFNYNEIWHTERDLYNKSIPEYQEHSSIVNAVVLYGIANLDHMLSRDGLYKSE